MPHRIRDLKPISLILALLLIIFTTEFSVMEFLSPVFARMDDLSASLLDAVILVLLYGIPLYFLVIRPLSESHAEDNALPRSAPMALFLQMLSTIFLVELLVMFFLAKGFPALQGNARNAVDGVLTILLSAPPLYWFLSRPQMRVRIAFLSEAMGAPIKSYFLLLLMVFLGEHLESLLVQLFHHNGTRFAFKTVDAYVISLFAAPFIWLLLVRPLLRTALYEKTRAAILQAQVIDAIMVINAQGMIETINPAAEQIFGYSAVEIAGRPAALLLSDGQQSLDEMLHNAAKDTNVNIRSESHEVSGRRRDGSLLVVDVSFSRVMQDGGQSYLAIMRDITRRKEAEAALLEMSVRLRDIFEQTEDAIFFFKPGTCEVIDVNPAAEKLYGYSKEELEKEGIEILLARGDFSRLAGFICDIRNSEITGLEKIATLDKDGKEIIVSVRGKMITMQGTEIIYVTMQDITAQIHLRENARIIQTKLIQANKMTSLGIMVSGVAHEINNPNNYIMANAQQLSRSWDDALKVLREYHRENGDFLIGGIPFSEMETCSPQLFAGIIDGARRIDKIIADLKSFARTEQAAAKQDVDINKVITTALSILSHELVKYTKNFHLDLDEGIPHVNGNGQQLGQVIINLLMNACQSLPDKQCNVWLTTGFDAATGQVSTIIRDEGKGIPPDVGNRIMEPFFTTKLDNGGTGLGLSICQSIVKDHNGLLEFNSEPGKGTTFIVRIPAINPVKEECAKCDR